MLARSCQTTLAGNCGRTGMVPPCGGVGLQAIEARGTAGVDAEAFAVVQIVCRDARQVCAHWEPLHHDTSI